MFSWLCALFTTTEGCFTLIWLDLFCGFCSRKAQFEKLEKRIAVLERRINPDYYT
jgi:hypothetical protein